MVAADLSVEFGTLHTHETLLSAALRHPRTLENDAMISSFPCPEAIP